MMMMMMLQRQQQQQQQRRCRQNNDSNQMAKKRVLLVPLLLLLVMMMLMTYRGSSSSSSSAPFVVSVSAFSFLATSTRPRTRIKQTGQYHPSFSSSLNDDLFFSQARGQRRRLPVSSSSSSTSLKLSSWKSTKNNSSNCCCCCSSSFRSINRNFHSSSLSRRRRQRPAIREACWSSSSSWSLSSLSSSYSSTSSSSRRTHATATVALKMSKDDNNNNIDYDNDEGTTPNNKMVFTRDTIPTVVPQRWIQLAYISILALLSDWICFAVAAVPDVYENAYMDHSAATLIDLFLFTNVASCFLVTDVVDKIGLQRAIQGAAILMAIGCWFRSGIDFIPSVASQFGWLTSATSASNSNLHLVAYTSMVIGTILVGAAQPFFQCTPPLLSATWFASQERATSTAIALNFNQVGIATAFIVGGTMATTIPGMENYFGLVSILSTLAAIGTCLQFENEPPIPPSASELEKKLVGAEEPPFLESVKTFFKTKGFSKALMAFICSISITNIVGAFIDDILKRGGLHDQFQIGLAGAGFEVAILIGGIIIGGYVDKTKQYKNVTLACLLASICFCIPLGLTQHVIGTQPLLLVAALLGLGFATGPVQPINAELAVDVTYPGDETAVESVQQIGGNLISALLVPIAEVLANQNNDLQLFTGYTWLESDLHADTILLVFLSLATMSYFVTFDAPLKRSMADNNTNDTTSIINGSNDDDKNESIFDDDDDESGDERGSSTNVVVETQATITTTATMQLQQQDSDQQQEQQQQQSQ